MKPPAWQQGWYPLVRSAAVGRKPCMRLLAGRYLLAWRDQGQVPRLVDPGTGAICRAIDADGFVLGPVGDPGSPPPEPLIDVPHAAMQIDGVVRAPRADVAENILDKTHTSVVHAGYLRCAGRQRSIAAQIRTGPDPIEAIYPQGAAPGGWGARLLGAERYTICDRFRLPAIAEVSYTDNNRPVFAARFRLAPRTGCETYNGAAIAVPGRGLTAALKLTVLRLFLLRIFTEDQAILERIAINRASVKGAPRLYAPADLLRPGIDALLDGRSVPNPATRAAIRV